MKKRFFAICLCLLLCLAAGAMADSPRVVDDAGLFSAAEERELEARIGAFQERTGMDFAIYTSSEPHEGSQQQVADGLYDLGGYGLGEDASGILYYIDMYERIPYLTTTGAMIDYMTDERIDDAHERCYRYLAMGDYAGAAERMISVVQDYVSRGIPEGQYRYDVLTGRRLTARHKALTFGEIVLCGVAALVAALLFVKTVEGRYRLKGSTYEYPFRENGQMNIIGQMDDYLRTTTTRARRSPPPSSGGGGGGHRGGSGVHTSSRGISHGGGAGRKF